MIVLIFARSLLVAHRHRYRYRCHQPFDLQCRTVCVSLTLIYIEYFLLYFFSIPRQNGSCCSLTQRFSALPIAHRQIDSSESLSLSLSLSSLTVQRSSRLCIIRWFMVYECVRVSQYERHRSRKQRTDGRTFIAAVKVTTAITGVHLCWDMAMLQGWSSEATIAGRPCGGLEKADARTKRIEGTFEHWLLETLPIFVDVRIRIGIKAARDSIKFITTARNSRRTTRI